MQIIRSNICSSCTPNAGYANSGGATIKEWQFTGKSPNPPGFRNGDIVSFSGLNLNPNCTAGSGPDLSAMNGGTFQIHNLQSDDATVLDPPPSSPTQYPDYTTEHLPTPTTKGYYTFTFCATYVKTPCAPPVPPNPAGSTSPDILLKWNYIGVMSPELPSAPANPSPTFARNHTRASQVIIRRNWCMLNGYVRQSLPFVGNDGQIARQAQDPADGRYYGDVYFCYNDRPMNDTRTPPTPQIMITELWDGRNREPTNTTTGIPVTDDIAIFFDSRGMPVNGTGYLLTVTFVNTTGLTGQAGLLPGMTPIPATPATLPRKIVTVNALGKASLGQS